MCRCRGAVFRVCDNMVQQRAEGEECADAFWWMVNAFVGQVKFLIPYKHLKCGRSLIGVDIDCLNNCMHE